MFEYSDVEGDKITVDNDTSHVFVSIEGIDDESGSVALPWNIAMDFARDVIKRAETLNISI